MAGVGDNSLNVKEFRENFNRVLGLVDQKDEIAADINAEMAALKAKGYDVKTIRKVIKISKMKKGVYEEEQMMIETYLAALDLI